MRNVVLLASILLAAPLVAQVPAALATDPVADIKNPPTMESFQLPSHGSLINALLYEAAGAGPHGTVILLHGFPGNEKNLDLAQAIRRSGWNVLYFDYRGSWGSPGSFSFTHCMEDTEAALAYLRDPANAKKLRVDSAKLVLIGHSMGGMIALYEGAHDPKVLGVDVFSAADMAAYAQVPGDAPAEAKQETLKAVAGALADEGMAPLAGCTPAGLAAELMAHPEWTFAQDATGLVRRPVLIVTSDDGGAAPAQKLADALIAADKGQARYVHVATDHSFSGKRIELETIVLSSLDFMDRL